MKTKKQACDTIELRRSKARKECEEVEKGEKYLYLEEVDIIFFTHPHQ